MIGTLSAWDDRLFLWINGFSGSRWDYLMAWPTHLITPLVFIPVLVYMLIWDGGGFRPVFRKFVRVAAGALSGGALALIVKTAVHRARPFAHFQEQMAAGTAIVKCQFGLYLSNSFPSAHTALAFGTAAALHHIYGKNMLFLYPLAFWLSMTRVYVGAHFPSDVLAGAVCGLAGARLALKAVKR